MDGNSLIPDCSLSTIQDKFVPITLYPNPTKDRIVINMEGYSGPVNVQMFDYSGKLLQNSNGSVLSLKNFPKGVDVLKVICGNVSQMIKIVKL